MFGLIVAACGILVGNGGSWRPWSWASNRGCSIAAGESWKVISFVHLHIHEQLIDGDNIYNINYKNFSWLFVCCECSACRRCPLEHQIIWDTMPSSSSHLSHFLSKWGWARGINAHETWQSFITSCQPNINPLPWFKLV